MNVIRPLNFVENKRGLQATALGFVYTIEPDDNHGWRWSEWERGTTASVLEYCESKEKAIAECNLEWQSNLAPYLGQGVMA